MSDLSFASPARAPWALSVPRGIPLLRANTPASGPAWRVDTGAFYLEHHSAEGSRVVQVALPGDVVGAEVWSAGLYATTVVALLDSEVSPLEPQGEAQTLRALGELAMQHQRQMARWALLRSGSAGARLQELLRLLRLSLDARTRLPALKDMARVLDAAPETVCRELTRLRPKARPDAGLIASTWIHPVSGVLGS